jgi:hypothetical protein
MRRRRSLTERTRIAVEQWFPFGSRGFALIVLLALAVLAIGMFSRW